jgi:hypothetical protein
VVIRARARSVQRLTRHACGPPRGDCLCAPWPRCAIQRCAVAPASISPSSGVPRCSSAISVAQVGKPPTKAIVPSIGSTTHSHSASGRVAPNSSPTMPWSGWRRSISARHIASMARSVAVTGLESALCCTSGGLRNARRAMRRAWSASS